MIELLDQVKLFGNAAIHEEDEDPTQEEVEDARMFAHLYLEYVHALPSRVEAAKTRREEKKP